VATEARPCDAETIRGRAPGAFGRENRAAAAASPAPTVWLPSHPPPAQPVERRGLSAPTHRAPLTFSSRPTPPCIGGGGPPPERNPPLTLSAMPEADPRTLPGPGRIVGLPFVHWLRSEKVEDGGRVCSGSYASGFLASQPRTNQFPRRSPRVNNNPGRSVRLFFLATIARRLAFESRAWLRRQLAASGEEPQDASVAALHCRSAEWLALAPLSATPRSDHASTTHEPPPRTARPSSSTARALTDGVRFGRSAPPPRLARFGNQPGPPREHFTLSSLRRHGLRPLALLLALGVNPLPSSKLVGGSLTVAALPGGRRPSSHNHAETSPPASPSDFHGEPAPGLVSRNRRRCPLEQRLEGEDRPCVNAASTVPGRPRPAALAQSTATPVSRAVGSRNSRCCFNTDSRGIPHAPPAETLESRDGSRRLAPRPTDFFLGRNDSPRSTTAPPGPVRTVTLRTREWRLERARGHAPIMHSAA